MEENATSHEPHEGAQGRKDPHTHTHAYSTEDLALAQRFSRDLLAKLKGFVREVVFFGSSARGADRVHESDIDVLVMVDDTALSLSNETVSAYRIITEKTGAGISGRLHINTIKLSVFFEYALNGDPLAVNIIRDGIPLLCAGILEPFKTLLAQGSIKPSQENIAVYQLRAPQTLLGSQWHILQGTIDLYWASLDAGHALLLHAGHAPNSPRETISLIDRYFVKTKKLDSRHLSTLSDLSALTDAIVDRSKKSVTGNEFSTLQRRCAAWISEAKRLMRAT